MNSSQVLLNQSHLASVPARQTRAGGALQQAQVEVARPNDFLRLLLALGGIHRRARDTDDLPARVAHRLDHQIEPARLAPARHEHLLVDRLASLQHPTLDRCQRLGGFGAEEFFVRAPKCLLRLQTQGRIPNPRVPQLAILIEDDERRRGERHPEPCFVLAQRRFHLQAHHRLRRTGGDGFQTCPPQGCDVLRRVGSHIQAADDAALVLQRQHGNEAQAFLRLPARMRHVTRREGREDRLAHADHSGLR